MTSLEVARKACGLTQRDVASIAKVAVPTYSQYETGARSIPSEKAVLIAQAVKAQVDDIFLPVKFTISKLPDGY